MLANKIQNIVSKKNLDILERMKNETDEQKKLKLYSEHVAQKMLDSRKKVDNKKIKLETIFGAI